ncbi:MAG: YodC family protein [Alphaproteobacteria bacterium]
MTQFSTGDLVRLKSGGPKMTVLEAENEFALGCQWFDRNGKLHTESFPTSMLNLFTPRPIEE